MTTTNKMRNDRNHLKRLLALILICAAVLMTGCSSLVFGTDMDNKETVKETEFGRLDDFSIPDQVNSYAKEKYSIGGTDAFYILPNGLPEPESIMDFHVVDFLNDTTLVYAYQSLYNLDDPTGRGGKEKTGVRPAKEGSSMGDASSDSTSPWAADDSGDTLSEIPDTVSKMVTVYMEYNTKTGAYNVFGSFVEEVEVRQESSYGTVNTHVYMKPASSGVFSMTQEGMTVKESNPLFTQKINGLYFLYHWGKSYLYDTTGRVKYYQDLTEALYYTSSQTEVLPQGGMIDRVFMDTRYHMYLQCSFPQNSSSSEERAGALDETFEFSEDDIEDEDPSNSQNLAGTQSKLFIVSQVSLGNSGNQDGQEYRYFVSENKNYEQEREKLLELDGSTVTFDGEPQEGDLEEWVNEKTEEILNEVKPSYGVYHFYQDLFPFKLYYTMDRQTYLYCAGNGVPDVEADENGVIRFNGGNSRIGEVRPELLASEEIIQNVLYKSPTMIFASTKIGSTVENVPIIMNSGGEKEEFEPQEAVTEPVTIKVNAVWEDEETGEEKSETFTCTSSLTKEYRVALSGTSLHMKVNAGSISGMTAPSGSTGYLTLSTTSNKKTLYGNEANAEYVAAELKKQWPGIADNSSAMESGVVTFQITEDSSTGDVKARYPTILSETARNILSIGTSGTNGSLENRTVIQSDKTLMVLLGSEDVVMVNVPMLLFDTHGDIMNIDDSQPSYRENDVTGKYLEEGLKLYQDQDGTWWLYAASPDKGILKVNLTKSRIYQAYSAGVSRDLSEDSQSGYAIQNKTAIEEEAEKESSGQISAYPYYCLWLDKDGKGCYALGFRTSAYSYSASDLCRSKLYHISFTDEEAAVNLAYSAARKSRAFQDAYARKDIETCRKLWESNIEKLGLSKEPEMVKTMTDYFEFLAESLTGKDKAYHNFAAIVTKSSGGRTITLNEADVRQRLESCETAQAVEQYMAELREDLSEENPYQETAGNGQTGAGTEQDTEKFFEQNMANEKKKNKIIETLKTLNGYSSQEAWMAALQEIADDMHPATTYAKYQMVKKQKMAAGTERESSAGK